MTANFNGGSVSSDAGLILIAVIDKLIGSLKSVGRVIRGPRDQEKIEHTTFEMLRQRGICQGFEDLNDQQNLRPDPVFQKKCWYRFSCSKQL